MNKSYQLGISQEFPCNYLPKQQERLLIAVDDRLQTSEQYAWLMSQGFRRSGEQIYRPHCLHCTACHSLRVLVGEYKPSKSQRRLINKNNKFTVKSSTHLSENYYPLFEKYINKIHSDGSMFPANISQYNSFLSSELTNQLFLEIWDNDKLISVAVTDDLDNALSAVYTFYHPDYRDKGIGMYSILEQIELAKELNKEFLYLGYQIDECKKMNYKNKFYPHQILKDNCWFTVNK